MGAPPRKDSDEAGYSALVNGGTLVAMTSADPDSLRDDHDSPWKEALSHRFPEFLALLFPEVHADIDWSRGHDFLDKELQQIVHDAEMGRRYADKLVRAFTRDGVETWVLIHIEVQGEPEAAFAERMYVYNYRLFDCYRRDVISLAVLADDSPTFRPSGYRRGRWGCDIQFRFPAVKLLDWATGARWEALETSDNVFALVVMAQIRAKASRDAEERKAWKFRLLHLMYDRGYERGVILELFRVIDWMIRLPRELEKALWQEAHALEESTKMAYVTSVERIGIEKGEAAVLLRLIARKYGEEAVETYRGRIEQADAETLLTWSERILTADRVEDIFR